MMTAIPLSEAEAEQRRATAAHGYAVAREIEAAALQRDIDAGLKPPEAARPQEAPGEALERLR